MELREIMTEIDFVVTEEMTLHEAIELMYEKKVNLLPVMNSKKQPTGVFTRSSMYRMIKDGCHLKDSIEKYIKREVETISISTPSEQIEEIVKSSKVGNGIVLNDDGTVSGILTKTDMVMSLLESVSNLKNQLETILEHTNMGVLVTDQNRSISFINPKLHEMSGKQLIGGRADMVFPELGAIFSGEESFISCNVEGVNTVATLSSYEAGYIILFRDTSEIERMASELQTVKGLKKSLETALENAYDGILMADENGRIRMVNPPLMDLFSLQEANVLNKPVEKVLPELQLSRVYKSESAEISDFMEINGIKYIVHRIPILEGGKVIGALGKVMFRQLNEVSEMFKRLQRAESKANFYQQQYSKAETAKYTWDQIWSVNPYMEKLKSSAAKAAKGRSTVLIRGESGTGKELFAHALHNSSARSSGKFVIVNCAAIPEELLESEFFGYEEGAFTGARQKGKLGKFDLANGGTLFLDEIGDMSVTLQAKLLRVLQEREFYRVGGTKKVHVDVRIVAATNRDLEKMVADGTFREDLYYRLNVISLNVPPLRERREDIPFLIQKLIEELNKMLGTAITGIEDEAKSSLFHYCWPGNVRELKNILERGMTFAEHGKIQMEDLPDYLLKTLSEKKPALAISLVENAELEAIRNALDEMKGNKAKAARMLGISRSGLYEKIKKYQLQ
ncbi:sigma-54-dependent Fis family transcriptional regulator [Neobacillus terrae]|uniref:sigma-54-dependent Fis family transcriptional regulator n=1 Tax=Neobacillus terrae TaxID=3034837 RepID=UPI00140CEE87|nr:sigma-54-dependent Fis family transcriptional regulator [Neobacillus terrae]NHM31970.1 sigma 54-interacting transcriptional regulator [Neobacillus terrae]